MRGDVDVAIVGGSFAGLAAGTLLARANRTVTVFDHRQPRNRFSAGVHGSLGFDGAPASTILSQARSDLARYPGAAQVHSAVVELRKEAKQFIIEADDGFLVSFLLVFLFFE